MVKKGGVAGYENPIQRVITFFWSIIYFIMAFFNSLFQPFISESGYTRGPGGFGGSGSGGSSGGGSSGGSSGGGGPQRRIGRLNTSSMDMSSCPTGGCCR
ncbi:hypothetical protein FO519_005449 [Halicephalobus sp. NKZ332]|nr:hypothetical protein FO519_005449 [Halicephalobus sp. NKZ332]